MSPASLFPWFRPACSRAKALVVLALLTLTSCSVAPSAVPESAPAANPEVAAYAQAAVGYLERGYHAEGTEWQRAREDLREAALTAPTVTDLYDPIRSAAQAAGGRHSLFFSPSEVEDLQERSQHSFETPHARTVGGATVITIPALGVVDVDQQEAYAREAADFIEAAAPTTCGWVIDVRGNRGGNMYPMLSGLTALLPNGVAMTFRGRNGETTVVTVQSDGVGLGRSHPSVGERTKVPQPLIAVLQDRRTASSGEAVVTAFLGLEGVRSFGVESAGLTSGNEAFTLPDGATLALTTSVYLDRTGRSLQEQPIPPDERMVAEQAETAALRWLARQGCR